MQPIYNRFRSRKQRGLCLSIAILLASAGTAMSAPRVDLSGLKQSQTYDRFIVRYHANSSTFKDAAAQRRGLESAAISSAHGKALGVRKLHRLFNGADVITADRKLDRVDAQTLMQQIATNPDVDYIEVDKLNQISLTPNDPQYGTQWGYSGAYGIKADQAWDVTDGAGVVVAVLDTGITKHSDLNANVLPGYDFVTVLARANDGNGRDSDPSDPGDWTSADQCGYPNPAQNSSWHGTHVAGTIAAVTNNAKGVAGVAHGAKIVPVRVLGTCGGYDSDIAAGMVWAAGGTVDGVPANANPAEVLNLSLGGNGACGPTMQNAIDQATSLGSTIVVAAGNANTDVASHSPANCIGVIAVASTTSTGERRASSNYGSLVDIAAPGSDILSTLNTGTTSPGSETYASYSGTSMATPHVAGVVALMQAVAETPKNYMQIGLLLQSTATPFPATPSQPIGPGIVNAKAAVDAVRPRPAITLFPGVAKTEPTVGMSAWLNFTMTVPAGATNLQFELSSAIGDGDMYVKFGSQPTETDYDCRPSTGGSKPETCTFAAPQAGTYYVRVKNTSIVSAITNARVVGNYQMPPNTLLPGVARTGLEGRGTDWLDFIMVVPPSATNLQFELSPSLGDGDADMYVKFGSQPAETNYDCRPFKAHTVAEKCTFAAPQPGIYYVRVHNYDPQLTFSGASLVGTYQMPSNALVPGVARIGSISP
jgi:serine protease